jgi:hypothetical protein
MFFYLTAQHTTRNVRIVMSSQSTHTANGHGDSAVQQTIKRGMWAGSPRYNGGDSAARDAEKIEHVVARWEYQSHKRQIEAEEDYQAIGWDFLNSPMVRELGITSADEDICSRIESSPHPDCTCGYCGKVEWQ